MTIDELRQQKLQEAREPAEWHAGMTVWSMAKRLTLEYAKALSHIVPRGTGDSDVEPVLKELTARGHDVLAGSPATLTISNMTVAVTPAEVFYGSVDIMFFWNDTADGPRTCCDFVFNTCGMDVVSVVDCIEEVGRFFAEAVEVFRAKERDELLRLTAMEIALAGVPQHTQAFMIMLDRFRLGYSRKVHDTCTEFTVDLPAGKSIRVCIPQDKDYRPGELHSVARAISSLVNLLKSDLCTAEIIDNSGKSAE